MKLQLLAFLLLISLHMQAQGFIESPFQDFSFGNLVVGDFDGDTRVDVLGIQFSSTNRIVLQVNNNAGAPGFTEKDLGLTLDVVGQPAAVDMDGDGDLDVIVAAGANSDLFLLKNDGFANFTADSLGISGTFVLQAGDLNSDGNIDIVGINTDNNDLHLYYNNGSQHFTPLVIPGFDNLEFLSLKDMDNDSDLDIVCGYDQFSGKQITIYLNLGTAGFGPINVAANELSGLDGMHVSDINGDGNQDIIFIYFFDCDAYVSQGGLTYVRKDLVSANNPLRSVSAADFNGDGRTDLAIGTNSADITWHKNLSNTTLTFETATVGSVSPAYSLISNDLDNDGDIDLVVSNGEFWWYENEIQQESATLNFSDKTISVYPNPVTDVLRLENIGQDAYSLNIMDSQGRNVFSAQSVSERIDLSRLNAGLYFLSLTNNRTQQTLSTRIIKQK